MILEYVFLRPDLEMKGQEVEDQLLSTHPPDMVSAGDGASQTLPAVSANRSELESTAAAQPPKIPPSEMRKRSDQTARSVSRHIHEMKKKKLGVLSQIVEGI